VSLRPFAPALPSRSAVCCSAARTAAGRAALQQTAERLGGAPADGRNDTYGYGLVQPADALPGLGLDTGSKK
jgi:hypothetical protein